MGMARSAVRHWVARAAAMCLCGIAIAAHAQIKIGQTAAFTGPTSSSVNEAAEGAKLYFESINAQGGVKGQKIELVTLDDQYDPKLAAANAKKLIVDEDVVALFQPRGTAQAQALLPLLAENKIALVAPASGAMALHQPVNPYVFNLRATHQREAERAVKHLHSVGVRRMTVVQVDDPFGNDAGMGALKGLEAVGLRALSHLRFDRNKPELEGTMQAIAKANIEAIVLIGPSYAVVSGIKALRAAGSTAYVATLSNNATVDFVKALGEHARGVIVTQLFPNERSPTHPLVREATALNKASGKGELTPAQLEGFASAKLMVEAIRRSNGKDVTRESVLQALGGLRKYDLGGLDVSFSATNHTGLEFADVSIIGPDGKFWR